MKTTPCSTTSDRTLATLDLKLSPALAKAPSDLSPGSSRDGSSLNQNYSGQSPPARTVWNILVWALMFFVAASYPAQAENHTTLPGAVVNTNTPAVAVDSSRHWIYSVNSNNQVQISFVSNNAWVTSPLGAGRPVYPGTKIYLDSSLHFLFYIGDDHHLWVWWTDGSQWYNTQLSIAGSATEMAGVDSSTHFVWYRDSLVLKVIYYNGSTWLSAPTGVNNYTANDGGAVDETSHALYWNDNNTASLRSVVFSGRAFVPAVTLDTNVRVSERPAVHQGTGEIYCAGASGRLSRQLPNFFFLRQDVGASDDIAYGDGSLAVNASNGKVTYCRYINGVSFDVAVLTPSGSGAGTTWTRTLVSGTNGHAVLFSAQDTVYNWYIYTRVGDTALHIVY